MMKDKITILSSHKLLCASGKFFLYCSSACSVRWINNLESFVISSLHIIL